MILKYKDISVTEKRCWSFARYARKAILVISKKEMNLDYLKIISTFINFDYEKKKSKAYTFKNLGFLKLTILRYMVLRKEVVKNTILLYEKGYPPREAFYYAHLLSIYYWKDYNYNTKALGGRMYGSTIYNTKSLYLICKQKFLTTDFNKNLNSLNYNFGTLKLYQHIPMLKNKSLDEKLKIIKEFLNENN